MLLLKFSERNNNIEEIFSFEPFLFNYPLIEQNEICYPISQSELPTKPSKYYEIPIIFMKGCSLNRIKFNYIVTILNYYGNTVSNVMFHPVLYFSQNAIETYNKVNAVIKLTHLGFLIIDAQYLFIFSFFYH